MEQTEGEKSWGSEKGMRERSEPVGERTGVQREKWFCQEGGRRSVMCVCVMLCSHRSFSALCVCRGGVPVCEHLFLLRKR